MGSTYTDRPWLSLYREGQPADLQPEYADVLSMFAGSLEREPQCDVLRYFDGSWTVERLAVESDALAVALLELGFAAGERLVLFTQNDPAFVIGMLAAWKCGGTAVTANPMYKQRELGHVLQDSGATAVLCLDELHEVVSTSAADTDVHIVVAYSALDGQTRDDRRVMPSERLRLEGVHDLGDLLEKHAGSSPPPVRPEPEDVCFLVYTSGTTGDPKGARLTHANFAFNAQSFRDWVQLEPHEGILGVAPLFHITGLVGHAILALLVPAPLVLVHRFRPEVVLDAIREHRPVFTIGAITAFTSLAGAPGLTTDDLASLTKLYSGGAPIAPAVADKLEARFGGYLHNAYGLTETSSITHLVPPDRRAPVDPESGALSVGVPISSTTARILDDDGNEVAAGEIGEVAIAGPQVASGYWGRPDASATAFPRGELRTGDVGFMDDDGWFFLVDRKKDMIIASGYKVWPREVEDVLYGHPAVREAAVIGVPDEYRGETVHAFVSLQEGAEVEADELIEHCKSQLAAYKYPRAVFFVDELPKTASGKILRRELR